jgi:general stress protein YciG
MSKVREYLAEIGRRGGQAKGPRKARSPEQYREMAKKSAQVRKKRASDSGKLVTGSKK